MDMQTLFPRRPAAMRLMTALFLGAAMMAPMTVDIGQGGWPTLTGAYAQARGGDDRGGDDSGGHGRGGDDRGGDDNGGRGRGGDDRGGDDNGGRGRGGDDRGGDDKGGHGRGGDDRGRDDRGGNHGRQGGRGVAGGADGSPTGSAPTRVERSPREIEVTYADGWREQLENGRYELKDAQNRTVVERPATRQDHERLGAIGR